MSGGDTNNQADNGPQASAGIRPGTREYELKYSSKEGTYFSQLYNQPLVTTLNSFSQVANLVRNPYELINNVDEFVKQHAKQAAASANTNYNTMAHSQRSSGPCTVQPASSLAIDGQDSSSGVGQPQIREMDEFSEGRFHPAASSSSNHEQDNNMHQLPPPALPPIECTNQQRRLPPLSIDEYIEKFQEAQDNSQEDRANYVEKLTKRVFRGSMDSNLLRRVLWPVMFNILDHNDKIVKLEDGGYEVIEEERNLERWDELKNKFDIYFNQWKSILPEQESRFSTFRERKSLIERDVIRCDRLHPFYVNDPSHLEALTTLLMTYMMYDFDIGYVQGMSDLAAPILYVFNGDLTRAFWVFTEVMKLFRRNFELSQKTIHFQLACLFRLIKVTDPCFAQYLTDHESSNCFFAFRCIVCQFKRELMKEDEDDYRKVLFLWDTVWCVQRLSVMKKQRETQESARLKDIDSRESTTDSHMSTDEKLESDKKPDAKDSANSSPTKKTVEKFTKQTFYASFDPNQADLPRFSLSETEKYVLSLCLSLIRRERDRIMACKLDGTEILQHFIDPKLCEDLDNFIEHATNIYSYLQNDLDISRLIEEEEIQSSVVCTNEDGYDLLNDYLIISAATGD